MKRFGNECKDLKDEIRKNRDEICCDDVCCDDLYCYCSEDD
jgi:hypothetical protein